MAGFLACCTVYAHASRTEACPIAVLEAMDAGKPVVAASVGGVPELIEDGNSGLLVPPGDVPAVAHAILRLLDASSSPQTYGRRARERAVLRFDIQRCVDSHAHMYAALKGWPEPQGLVPPHSRARPVA